MSSTDPREQATSQLESERTAMVGLDATDPLRLAYVGRLQAAWEELRAVLWVLGVDDLEEWIALRIELEVLFKAMAWDHWCLHHVQRNLCPPP